jgi:hypothetical protein
MTNFILTVLAMIVLGVILGAIFNPGIGLLAIPVVLVGVLNIVMVGDTVRRQRSNHKTRQFRSTSRPQRNGLSEDDRRTVV